MVRIGGIVIKIIFDADMFLFVALCNAETDTEWEDEIWTKHLDLKEAKVMFDAHVMEVTKMVCEHWNIEGDYEIVMCLTSTKGNFRNIIFEDYKANRKGNRKPMCYKPMRQYIREFYNVVEYPMLEADDCVGIIADEGDIIVSGDKDFRSIPCRLYDFKRNEYYDTTLNEANEYHLYQTLVGDATDGYKGCPKIGDVRAKRILEEQGATWETVADTYKRNKSTEEEALVNARLAFILRKGYYNEETGEVRLWTPCTEPLGCKTLKTY